MLYDDDDDDGGATVGRLGNGAELLLVLAICTPSGFRLDPMSTVPCLLEDLRHKETSLFRFRVASNFLIFRSSRVDDDDDDDVVHDDAVIDDAALLLLQMISCIQSCESKIGAY